MEIENGTIPGARLVGQLGNAWLLDWEGNQVWFPRSKCNFDWIPPKIVPTNSEATRTIGLVILEKRYTKAELSEMLDMAKSTLDHRLKTDSWRIAEIALMIMLGLLKSIEQWK